MEKKNWFFAAGKVWDRLAEAAKERHKPCYEDLAPIIPTNPLSVGRALGPIQNYCRDRHPPLTAIVISKTTGMPGHGFNAWDMGDIEAAQQLVFDTDWKAIPNPFLHIEEQDSIEFYTQWLLKNPGTGEDIWGKVKLRGFVHEVFRHAVRKAYAGQCAICGLTFTAALDAAHIVPWAEASESQRIDPRNGLLLCALHHRLFDSGQITLTENGKIAYSDHEMKKGYYSKSDRQMSTSLHGKNAFLPMSTTLHPLIEFLRHHHKKHKFSSLV